jgi:hypothetical protein
MMSRFPILLIAAATVLPALADTQFRIRQMTRNDVPPGKGQCDIRLQVDQEAQVTVRGDMVSIRTIAGRDPRDDGSECNLPLPGRDLAGFNYEVKDSRGDIRLVGEPSPRNGFAAVVYIRDSAGGEGRYHFRLSWAIGGGGGYVEPPRRDNEPPRRDYPRDDRRGGFRWDDVVNFRGEGRGSVFFAQGGERRIFGVTLDIDRRGGLNISFRMEGGRTLTFAGTVVGREGGRLRADVEGMRVRGPMFISVDDRRNVNSITMEGSGDRERVRLTWDRR